MASGEGTNAVLPESFKPGERVIIKDTNEVGYVKSAAYHQATGATLVEGSQVNGTKFCCFAPALVRWPVGAERPVAIFRRTVVKR